VEINKLSRGTQESNQGVIFMHLAVEKRIITRTGRVKGIPKGNTSMNKILRN
jgi:hypothetical protein